MNWTKKDWLLLVALTILAAALRLYQLGVVPPGFQFDEAFNGIDAYQVLEGNRPLFLPANAGREVLYTYWQALLILLVGFFTGDGATVNVFTLRLGSALGGILAIPAIYLFLRFALKKHGRAIAFFVAISEGISLWHIHFSHYGIRVILMPVLFTVAFGLFWVASSRESWRNQILCYILCGIATGLTVWNHPTGRFTPFVLILYTAWLWFTANTSSAVGRPIRTNAIKGLIITGVVAFLVFLPLGLVFLDRPDFFIAHVANSSVLNDDVYEGSPVRTLLLNGLRILGMFNISGDTDWTHNLPGRPVFDPFISVPFLAGLYLWGRRIADKSDPDRNLLALMLIWFVIMLTPSLLSNDAPDYSRTMPSHPALMIAPGLGLAYMWYWSSAKIAQTAWRRVGPVVASLIVLISGGLTFYDYFVTFANSKELYYVYDVDKLDALNSLAPMTTDNTVYLSELWAGHATSTFLRGRYGIKSIETSHTLVLPPPGKGAVYAFPDEQAERADDLRKIFHQAVLIIQNDPQGKPLLHSVHVDAESAAQWPIDYAPVFQQEAFFEDGPTLLGMTPRPDGSLLLHWRGEKSMLRNLTAFVHLLDPNGENVAQADQMPGNGSYGTPVWSPGERVIDRYWPAILDPCSSGVEVRAVVGWYELLADGLRRPRADSGGEIAQAGTMRMPLRSRPIAELSPAISREISLSDAVNVVGYTIDTQGLEPGSPFTLDLFWEGNPGDQLFDLLIVDEQPVSTQEAKTEDVETLIWRDVLGEGSDWAEGRRLCRRLYLRVPTNADQGTYQVQLGAQSGELFDLFDLPVSPSTRLFTPPSSMKMQSAHFRNDLDEQLISLLGFEIQENDDQSLEVSLVWQADSPINVGLSAFVHAVNESGELVAQSDAVPSGIPTIQWVPEEVVIDHHTLRNLPEGSLSLFVGLYDPLTGQRLLVTDDKGLAWPDNAVNLMTSEH